MQIMRFFTQITEQGFSITFLTIFSLNTFSVVIFINTDTLR